MALFEEECAFEAAKQCEQLKEELEAQAILIFQQLESISNKERWIEYVDHTRAIALQSIEEMLVYIDVYIESKSSTPLKQFKSYELNLLRRFTFDLTNNDVINFQLVIESNDVYAVHWMLFAGVDPHTDNNRVIQWASENGHVQIIDMLLQDKTGRVDPSINNNWPFQLAVINQQLAVVERMLQDARVDPSTDDNYAFLKAVENKDIAMVERLLQDTRVDPSTEENLAFAFAVKNNDLVMVERLLQDPRVDPSPEDNFAFRFACKNGYYDIVERLLQDPRIDLNDAKSEIIRLDSTYKHLPIVNRILQDPRVVAILRP
jgi:ankyrin repeat protein